MKSRVLFLDYDGVVNTQMWNETGTKLFYNYPQNNKVNNFQAVRWVSEFCLQCKFDIVVTSSWREEANYKECLLNGGLKSGIEILGCLPLSDDKTRGELIREYLQTHPEIKHYVIVDDENRLLPEQQSRFVKVNENYGFNKPEYQRCVKIYMKHSATRQ